MNIDTRHEMAMNYASILGFKPGDFKLMELEKGGFALFCVDGVEYLVVKTAISWARMKFPHALR